jgi:transcriptional regulator with XRE-family HTH domain
MNISERFAANLAAQRKRVGISQEELASLAGLHRTQISLLETGKREPRLETMVKLAGGLGIPVATLVDGIR